MQTDFSFGLQHKGRTSTLACAGELDLGTSDRLQEGIELCLESNPTVIRFDGRQISLLTSPGIQILYRLAETCAKSGISLEMQLSPSARKVLDLVGLWWLGVADYAFSVDGGLDRALQRFGNLDSTAGPSEPRLAEGKSVTA
ncbi:MAG: STAS domain-containing protein [Actinomycetota bacterium]